MVSHHRRGFAALTKTKRKRISSLGGRSQGAENNPGNFAYDHTRASRAGKKGGRSAQRSGKAHILTSGERSIGGMLSGGNFANNPDRASRAGKTGSQR
jgi:general stress protein YciG